MMDIELHYVSNRTLDNGLNTKYNQHQSTYFTSI